MKIIGFIVFHILCFASMIQAQSGTETVFDPEEPLTIEQCIQIALEHQPLIRASEGAIITSNSEYTSVNSIRFPLVQLEGGAFLTNNTVQFSNAIGSTTPEIDNKGTIVPFTRLTFKQQLYDFGRTDRALRAKRKLITAANMGLDLIKSDVSVNVRIAYYNYMLALKVVAINEERVAQSQQHLAKAKSFFEIGTISDSEVSQAELNLSNSELELINARGQAKLAQIQLNNSMGVTGIVPFAKHYKLVSELSYIPFTADLAEAIGISIDNRKDILAADLKLKATRSTLSAAKSRYYPIISASGGLGPYIKRLEEEDRRQINLNYTFGINLNWPIFQGLSVNADIAEAQGNIRIAESQLSVRKQKAIQEVQEAYHLVKLKEESYKGTEKIVAQANRSRALAKGRYDTGLGSAIEVMDANVAVANSKITQTRALHEYHIALVNFQKAVGIRSEN